jgi:hypothetical protein
MNTREKIGEAVKKDIDHECVVLCEAMNKMPGIHTVQSCCGHGKDEFCIWFKAENLEVLPALLYWFDICHSGVAEWEIIVETDCAMSPVTFLAKSTSKGIQAYSESNIIAECIEKYLDEYPQETA